MAAEIDRAVAQPSVLIVEDEVLISFGLALALNVAGYRVLGPTGSVRRALDIAAAEHPEMALVDINLAGNDEGIGLCAQPARAARDHDPFPHRPAGAGTASS